MNTLHNVGQRLQQVWTDLQYKRIANYDLNGYRRVYHIHVRKSGGTSLNHMFLAFGQETDQNITMYKELAETKDHRLVRNGKVYVAWNNGLINQGNYFYAFSHLPLHLLKLPPHTFTVTILRDPLKRIISLYKMLVEYRDNKIDHPTMKIQGPWLGESFDDFLGRIPPEHLLRQLYMFSPTFDVNESFERITNCSHFMFTEDFGTGIASLNSKLGIELQPIHIRQSQSAPSISEKQISRLRDMLAKEYELTTRLKEYISNQVIA